MKRRTKLYSIISAAMLGAAMLAVPATAHEAPQVADCIGTADVKEIGNEDTGLSVFTDRHFTWEITVGCDLDGNPLDAPEATLHASGTGFGRCGASTASGGTGTVTYTGETDHDTDLLNIGWTSGGTVLHVTGDHDNSQGDGADHGDINAEVQAGGSGTTCLDDSDGGGAKVFNVNIAAVLS